MEVEEADLETISSIVPKYGFIEWTLIGFTPSREYNIFSYFTDQSILPVFKAVLLSIFKTLNEYMEHSKPNYEEAFHGAGSC